MLYIRPMQFQDVEAVHAMELEAHKLPWSLGIIHDCVLVGYDCRVLEQNDEHGLSMLGYIISRIDLNTCHILNICIAPAFQNKGFGKFFLSKVLESLKERMIDTILLEVRPTNLPALALYKSFGFHVDAVKERYYVGKEKGDVEDALVLKKIL